MITYIYFLETTCILKAYLDIYQHSTYFFPFCFNINFAMRFILLFYRRNLFIKLFYYDLVLFLKLPTLHQIFLFGNVPPPPRRTLFKPDI